ncbi:MAG: type 4a pilus biogenesis protein PilO [Deltaproteobacteria bacterium]|nr:type 4a pilus biogenesis protein PilO [Deltaproteobacteria bacterium]
MAINVLDKLNKIPFWQKMVVLLVLVAAVVATSLFMYWKPLDQKITALQGELQQLERTYKEQKAVADDLATFQANTKKLEEDLRIALTQLPREKEIPTLLRDIYTLGRKSGVEFKTFQPQGEINRKLYAEIPVKLQIVGAYHEIAVFFDRIGKLSRIVNVSDLDISSQVSKDKETMLTVNCNVTTFMFLGSGT